MNESAQVIAYTSHGRMAEAEYDKQRSQLRDTYGDNKKEAGVKYEQALAILFYRSGWTQEQLAKKEKRGQQRISDIVRFGRFLNFTSEDDNFSTLPKNLNENLFSFYWKNRTDNNETNERIRFREIKRLMDENTIISQSKARKGIGPEIVEHFADGKWHNLDVIATRIDAPKDDVIATLAVMRERGSYKCKCESKRVGKSTSYRIFHQENMISSKELATKLTPIIEGLIAEGKKHSATISISAVARLAALLKRQLDEWSE